MPVVTEREASLCFARITTPELDGELYLPGEQSGAAPAIVVMSSSAGVCDTRERFYARFFANRGVASFVVDSFGRRKVVETISDQSRISDRDMEADAYAAFDFMARHPKVDSTRIAVMGVSRGGLVALNTGLTVRRRFLDRQKPDFVARIAVVPPAHIQQRDPTSDDHPVLFLLGGRDDYTGFKQAQDYASRITEAGNPNVRVVVYPEAHHAWERLGPPMFLPDAENYSQCDLYVEDDSFLKDRKSGQRMTFEEFFEKRQYFRTFGAHVGGGTAAFREQAAYDILEFLKSSAGWAELC